MQVLRDLKDQNIIKVITGVRRCGKSTLLQMFADELLQNGVSPAQIQFYNFEDLDTLALGDIFQVHTHIKNKLIADKMNYIVLDEVQNLADFQRLVDSLYIKPNCDVYITGSNAYLLSGELATLLTGRYIETEMLPFSYREYLDFLLVNPFQIAEKESITNIELQDNRSKFLKLSKKESFRNLPTSDALSADMVRNETLLDYIFHGGLPFAVHQDEKQNDKSKLFLQSVLNTIIEKDIFVRHEIYAKQSFRKLIDFLMDSIGSLVSPNSIAGVFKTENVVIDNKTVSQYLDYIATSFLFYKVPRYDVKGKNLLRTFDKYYLSDTGFRKIRLARGKKADLGHLLENAVYLELRRRYNDVFVGKWNDREVDFVAIDHDGYTSYYQVAWTTVQPETLERELASLNAIKDSNPKYLLTTDIDFNPVYNGIQKLNVVDWMLNVNFGEKLDINDDRLGVKLGANQEMYTVKYTVNQKKIITLIVEYPEITVADMMLKLGISESGIKKNLKKLKELSVLERVGADKNGYWKIIANNEDEK
jgi:predicted AAA+ superfamily ATPase